MPLLIPGLTEGAAKKMAKRLHKALTQHPGTPSLTQLQTLLAQAAGHADWYAAQRYWATSPVPPNPLFSSFQDEDPEHREQRFKDHINEQTASQAIGVHLPLAWKDWQMARSLPTPPNGLLDALAEHLAELKKACALVHLEKATVLCDRLVDLAFKTQNSSPFYTTEEVLALMRPLLERLEYTVQQWPAQGLPAPPTPPDAQEVLRTHATLVGDWSVLRKAIEQAQALDPDDHRANVEASAALSGLCAWWNAHAPAPLRTAGCFQVHLLDPKLDALWCLGEPDAPATVIDDFCRTGNYALFESPQGYLVAVLFMKGRKHERHHDGTTFVFLTDGSLLWDMGCTPEEVNSSYAAARGLQLVAHPADLPCFA